VEVFQEPNNVEIETSKQNLHQHGKRNTTNNNREMLLVVKRPLIRNSSLRGTHSSNAELLYSSVSKMLLENLIEKREFDGIRV
jgi:hypothetical protein